MTEPVVRGRRLGATMRSFTLLSLAVAALLLAGCTVAPGAGAGGGGIVVVGTVLAGPTCPVQRPGDSACADRPVADAVLDVTTVGGAEVARVTSDGAGGFQVTLPVGAYALVPQPVPGLLGTAPSIAFTVAPSGASAAVLDVRYDTGIR